MIFSRPLIKSSLCTKETPEASQARKLQFMENENRIRRTGTDDFQIRPRTTSTPLPGKLSLPSFATPSSFRVALPNSPLSSTETSSTPPILAPFPLADCSTQSVVPDVLPDLPVFFSVVIEAEKKKKPRRRWKKYNIRIMAHSSRAQFQPHESDISSPVSRNSQLLRNILLSYLKENKSTSS